MESKEIVVVNNDAAKDVNREAAQWFARLRAPHCGTDERLAFERWLNASDANRRSYEAVSRSAELIDVAVQEDPRWQALLQSSATADLRGRRIPAWQRWGIAASIATLGLAGAVLATHAIKSRPAPTAQHYGNDGRQERVVALSDGSRVHLDPGSDIAVLYSRQARQLSLTRGRAYFEVAADRQRPFSVDAAGTRTIATGTRFEVDLRRQTVMVTLAEGSVSVSDAAREAWRESLTPGEQLVYRTADATRQKRAVDAERAVAWSKGRLYFDGTPLGEALEEINRYLPTPIVLGDETLAAVPIGGSFAAGGDASVFVAALAAILPIEAHPAGGRIVVYARPRGSARQQ